MTRIHAGVHDAPKNEAYHAEYREVPVEGKWEIVYGKDHACGYFIQFFPVDEKAHEICNKDGDGECLDLDQTFGHLKSADYLAILLEFGINEYM